MAHRAGRKRQSEIARYRSGDAIREASIMAPAQWARLRQQAAQGAADPNWSTQIGQLFALEKLSAIQVDVATRLGNLMRAYIRIKGIPSPEPYVPSNGAMSEKSDLDVPRAPMSEAYSEQRDMATLEAYESARALLSGRQLACLGRLCLEDRAPSYAEMCFVGSALDRVAAHWRLTSAGKVGK